MEPTAIFPAHYHDGGQALSSMDSDAAGRVIAVPVTAAAPPVPVPGPAGLHRSRQAPFLAPALPFSAGAVPRSHRRGPGRHVHGLLHSHSRNRYYGAL
jgi:hypothetical protein